MTRLFLIAAAIAAVTHAVGRPHFFSPRLTLTHTFKHFPGLTAEAMPDHPDCWTLWMSKC